MIWRRASVRLAGTSSHLRALRRTCVLVALSLAGLALHAPMHVVAATQPHVLRFATGADVPTLNPLINEQDAVGDLTDMTGAFLFRRDRENRLTPELALSVPTEKSGGISADGTTVILHVRQRVKWSDGAPFDADDVKFTVEAINNPANNVRTRTGFDRVTRIDEPDKFTAILHLKAPYGAIVPKLGEVAMLPKHLLGSLPNVNNAAYNALPIGIGPFRYAAWKRGDQIELERNPYYWRGQPKLERVILKLITDENAILAQLQTGEIDLAPIGESSLSRMQGMQDVRVIRRPSYRATWLVFNLKSPELSDRNVRLALRQGLDRRSLRDKLSHGAGGLQDGFLVTLDPSTPRPFTEYDPAKANALLDAAGWKRGSDDVRQKNGTRLSLVVATLGGLSNPLIEFVRSDYKRLGVELNVKRYQPAVLFGPYEQGGIMETGKFGVFLGTYIEAQPPDITNTFACSQFPPAGENVTRFCNPKFDALAAQYDRAYDETKRSQLLAQALQISDDDIPAVCLRSSEALFAIDKAVKNFDPIPDAPFADMMQVDI